MSIGLRVSRLSGWVASVGVTAALLGACGPMEGDGALETSQVTGALGSSDILSQFAKHSLMLTMVSTVSDPLRTSDPCKAPDATKKWSFGYLMNEAAKMNGVTGTNFVTTWVTTFATPPLIGADRPASGGVGGQIASDWKARSMKDGSSSYLLKYAPFRLLAITPRFDLRKNRRFGEGNAGELRFVFGLLRTSRTPLENGTCTQGDPSSIILEYAVDRKDENDVQKWVKAWSDLVRIDPGSEPYRAAVQVLTESVVNSTSATRGRLLRIRTNTLPSGTQPSVWDLREWNVSSSTHLPTPVTVKQSPRMVLLEGPTPASDSEAGPAPPYDSPLIGDWINNHETALFADTYVVPDKFPSPNATTQFLGGFNLNNMTHNRAVYSARIRNGEARHLFGKGTCVGCHSVETGPRGGHFHIAPRDWEMESALSDFLTGGGTGQFAQVPDPIDPSSVHFFNELDAREDDANHLLNNLQVMPVPRAAPVSGEPSIAGQYYTVRSLQSGMCVDVVGNSTGAGASLQIVTCNGTANQRVMLERQTSGAYHLRIKNSGMCIEGSDTSTAITQHTCSTTTRQNVFLQQMRGFSFNLQFQLQKGGVDQCVSAPAGTTNPRLVQKACYSDSSQPVGFVE